MLHVHVLLVAPLGAGHMAQPGTDQHESRVAVGEAANYTGAVRTPLKKCSLTADDGASPPLEWCTASAEMVHGGRGRGAPGRHAGDYSGMPLRLRMDSPSIWMV